MDLASSFFCALGVITARTLANGRADAVLYQVRAAWVLGGEGEIVLPSTRPVRLVGGDDQQVTAAPVGSPCKVTRDHDGTIRLFVDCEMFDVGDCE